MMKVTISRKAWFNAAHRLYNPTWPDEKNDQVFGKCNNPNFHGHNYILYVSVTGDVNPETGYVMDMSELKRIINDEVIEYLDHKNLNLDIPEFALLNPTAENIVIFIYQRLRPLIHENHQLGIKLYETENNIAEVSD